MAKLSNCNFLLEATLEINFWGATFSVWLFCWEHVCPLEQKLSCHIRWRYADNSIRRVFTYCQSLSQAYISTDVTADVSILHNTDSECWNLHKYVQTILWNSLYQCLIIILRVVSLIRSGVKDYMKMSKLLKNQIFELNFITLSPSYTRYGVHLIRDHDVRVNHRAAVMAGGRDGLLLQEDRSSGRGSAERERVSHLFDQKSNKNGNIVKYSQ